MADKLYFKKIHSDIAEYSNIFRMSLMVEFSTFHESRAINTQLVKETNEAYNDLIVSINKLLDIVIPYMDEAKKSADKLLNSLLLLRNRNLSQVDKSHSSLYLDALYNVSKYLNHILKIVYIDIAKDIHDIDIRDYSVAKFVSKYIVEDIVEGSVFDSFENAIKIQPIFHINPAGMISNHPIALEVFARLPIVINNIRKNSPDSYYPAGPLFYAAQLSSRFSDDKNIERQNDDIKLVARLDNICLKLIMLNISNIKKQNGYYRSKQEMGIEPSITINITRELITCLFDNNNRLSQFNQKLRNTIAEFEDEITFELSESLANEIDYIEPFKKFLASFKTKSYLLDDCQPSTSWLNLKISKGMDIQTKIRGIKIDYKFFQKIQRTGTVVTFEFWLNEMLRSKIFNENTILIFEGVNDGNVEEALNYLQNLSKKFNVAFQYFSEKIEIKNDWRPQRLIDSIKKLHMQTYDKNNYRHKEQILSNNWVCP